MALRTLRCLIDGLATSAGSEAIIAHRPEGPVVWTRQKLHAEVERFAGDLVAAGVSAGEPVALLASSRPEWAAAMLAIVRAGAVTMPVSEQTTEQDLARILEHSGCRRVITTADYLKRLAALDRAADLEIVLLDDATPADHPGLSIRNWREAARGEHGLPEIEPDQPAVLVYTSGTTGTPKGMPTSARISMPWWRSISLAPMIVCSCRCRSSMSTR